MIGNHRARSNKFSPFVFLAIFTKEQAIIVEYEAFTHRGDISGITELTAEKQKKDGEE